MTESTQTAPSQKPPKKKETFGEMVFSLVFMIFLALVFRSLAFEPFHIPSGSMLSTLYEGDYIFVSKYSYGYSRYSFPFSPKLFDGRIFESKPARGDVVVFRNPADPKTDYIKRIIGLPGDTIQVRHARLFINGQMVDQTRDGTIALANECGEMHAVDRYVEALPGGRNHTVLDDTEITAPMTECLAVLRAHRERSRFDPDNTEIYTVPEGQYFMMGDNRDHSQDSRFSPAIGYDSAPGFVPFENFVGRAEIIAFSWSGEAGRWFKRIE